MVNSIITPKVSHDVLYSLKRREQLLLNTKRLWYIEGGAVRTYTFDDDGIITLGFWGKGDIIGKPFACIQPYEAECLMSVELRKLQPDECWNLNQLLLSHLHQTQALLQIRNGKIHQRLQQLLDWLAYKFGQKSERGQLIPLRLTHQDIAETIGTTRVTVTRLLGQLEQEGHISWARYYLVLCRSPRHLS
jgi:CRP-like cAMP-binding protein